MSDFRHRKMNILPVTAAVLLCLCFLSFTRVGSVYGRLTDEKGTPSEYATDSDASRYYDYSRATPSEVERIEVESTVIEIPEPDPIEGYEFLGWNTCEDGTGEWYYPGDLFEMTEECTDFYAIWEKILKATPSQAVKTATGSDAIPLGGGGAGMVPAAVKPAEETAVPAAEQTEELKVPETDEEAEATDETSDGTVEETDAAEAETSEETAAETEEVTETEAPTETATEITETEVSTEALNEILEAGAESTALIEKSSSETEAASVEIEEIPAAETSAEAVETDEV